MYKRTQALSNLENLLKLSLQIHRLNRDIEKTMDLSLVQTLVLIRLKDLPGITAQGLSKQIGVHPSTLTPMLKRLGKLQYIFLSQDPKDSRKTLVALSRKGKTTLDNALDRLTDILWHNSTEEKLSHSVAYLDTVRKKIINSKSSLCYS